MQYTDGVQNRGAGMHAKLKRPMIQHPLARKLAIVTLIKLGVLLGLWWVFFHVPGEQPVTADQAADAILHPNSSNATEARRMHD